MTVKLEKKQQLIDIKEAFSVWDILNSKYLAVERLQIWDIFIHDVDLKLLITLLIKTLKENISILEKEMEKYAVKAPDQNRNLSNSLANSKIVTDEFIALDTFLYLQEHIENLFKAMRCSVTNDSLRTIIKKMLLKSIEQTDAFIKYLRVKGWLSTPPMYKQLPENVEEKLSTAEAANLWEHLTLRYDNIKTTEIFINITHDSDFKALLQMGLKQLKKQVNSLEKELRYFGIPLPKKPAKVTFFITNTEVLDDDYMYRILINAFQGAALLHARSFKEAVVNDRIRNFFKKLLMDELTFIDRFFRYGKLKGWLNPSPTYGP